MLINEIISLSTHCLHLCNNSNIEETVFSYLMNADAFVTNNTAKWKKKFNENEIKCPIKSPNDVKQGERIVVDGSSLGSDFEKWEKKWKKQKKAICIYNIDGLDPSILKSLVSVHDKMILSVNKRMIVSDKHLEKEIDNLSSDIVENLVKRELKNIIISLLLSKPMCGTDLVKLLYKKFKVLISPGMLYPTLHELERSGLLNYEYRLKNKVYSIREKEEAKHLLKRHIKVNSLLLSQFSIED